MDSPDGGEREVEAIVGRKGEMRFARIKIRGRGDLSSVGGFVNLKHRVPVNSVYFNAAYYYIMAGILEDNIYAECQLRVGSAGCTVYICASMDNVPFWEDPYVRRFYSWFPEILKREIYERIQRDASTAPRLYERIPNPLIPDYIPEGPTRPVVDDDLSEDHDYY